MGKKYTGTVGKQSAARTLHYGLGYIRSECADHAITSCCCLLSTHADRQGVDISITFLCVFVRLRISPLRIKLSGMRGCTLGPLVTSAQMAASQRKEERKKKKEQCM